MLGFSEVAGNFREAKTKQKLLTNFNSNQHHTKDMI